MIEFTADSKTYKIKSKWEEVTLVEFIQYIDNVNSKMPKCLKDYLIEEDEEKAQEIVFTSSQRLKVLEYQIKCVCFFSDLDESTAKKVNKSDIAGLYGLLQRWLNIIPKYNYENIIEHEGIDYYLPEQHMQSSSYVDFTTCCDLEIRVERLKKSHFTALPEILSILLQEHGKKYDYTDNKEMQRKAKLFLTMSMDKVLHVAFFLNRLNNRYNVHSIISLKARQVAKLRIQNKALREKGVGMTQPII